MFFGGKNSGWILPIFRTNSRQSIFEKKAIDYIKSLLSNYDEGEYLVNEHIDFIITCLGKSKTGMDLINEGVVKVLVKQTDKSYTIEVITNSSCVTIPINRIFGEKTKFEMTSRGV